MALNMNPTTGLPVNVQPGTIPGVAAHSGHEPAPVAAQPTGITAIINLDLDAAHAAGLSTMDVVAQMGLALELNDSQLASVESLPAHQLQGLQAISGALTSSLTAGMSGENGTGVVSQELGDRWRNFVSEAGNMVDVNALVQWVLRESYNDTTKDLYFYAEKVKFFNECKKAIREEIQRARDELVKYAGKDDTTALSSPFTPQRPNSDFTGGNTVTSETGSELKTKAELDNYIQEMEEKLNSVGDDAQLANVDLQNMLQKQQQTMQMMSNISKMLHDTAMAIIRKIGG